MYRRVHASGSQSLLQNYSTSPIRAMEGNMVLVIQAIEPLLLLLPWSLNVGGQCYAIYVYEVANVAYAELNCVYTVLV